MPKADWNGSRWVPHVVTVGAYTVERYRRRIEGNFARIEKLTHASLGTWWRVCSRDNSTTFYGLDPASRVTDPVDRRRIFEWLPALSFDDQGNCVIYEYKPEDGSGVKVSLAEATRLRDIARTTNVYLKHVRYGNRVPCAMDETDHYRPPVPAGEFLFHTVFDYGQRDPLEPTVESTPGKLWSRGRTHSLHIAAALRFARIDCCSAC